MTRMESPEINPYTYDQLTYDKEDKKTVSSTSGASEAGQPHIIQ